MNIRPIIFSGPMVRALLNGRKTQTRRVIKARMGKRSHLPEFCGGRYDNRDHPANWGWEAVDRGEWITLDQFRRYNFVPYAVGDRLWVREAHAFTRNGMTGEVNQGSALFRADATDNTGTRWPTVTPGDPNGEVKWRSSAQMPRWASRLTLVVTDVRVQRLQDISEADAVAEGGPPSHPSIDRVSRDFGYSDFSRSWFAQTWNSLYGPDAWDANPWVSATTFTVHRCNVDQMLRNE